jgi:polar amino acid transport system permease protein
MPAPFDLLPTLLQGLQITVVVTAGATLVAAFAAFGAGFARLSRHFWLRIPALVYIDLFRGTSALVQLFWAYFALPLLGIRLEAVTVGIVVLGLNAGAYGAEIVRGAMGAVPVQQREAAIALNFTEHQAMWRIVLPQALLAMLPPFGNLLIELLKSTALVSLITLNDLTFQGQLLRSATLRSGEIFGWVLLLYFLLALAISQIVRGWERWLAIGRDHGGLR